ncbi:MAG: DUF4178 domain-containing protein, partial [Acidobacteria bacterium]|nr:DUF4178 domain-containing protein [Acidobacteriota bacterium]
MGLAAPAPLKVRALVCPNCGGSVALRGYGHSVNAVCEHCLTVLDTTTPSLAVLQKYGKQERIDPKIPLGSRGKLEGAEFEVIGFQVRTITVDGIDYSWSEYLLFHPYKGYRYLSE